MDLKKSFGQNLQKYRKLRKLTQEGLAEKVGVDATSISSIETGKFFPTADNLQKIACALNVKLETLFCFDFLNSNEEIYKEILGIMEEFQDDSKKLNAIRIFLRTLV